MELLNCKHVLMAALQTILEMKYIYIYIEAVCFLLVFMTVVYSFKIYLRIVFVALPLFLVFK